MILTKQFFKMGFFNTTQEKDSVLKEYSDKTESQERKILNIFRKSKTGLTASEVFRNYPDRNVPLTSIRRAITNLCYERKVEKLSIKREGIYGRKEFVYNLYTGQFKLFES